MKHDYSFDTHAWAEYFDGTDKGKIVKAILESNSAVFTSILAFAELSEKCFREGKPLTPLLECIHNRARIIGLNLSIAINAGTLKQKLRKINNNVSLADAIHFQSAKQKNSIFVTGDPDFKYIKDVLFLE